MVPLGRPSMSEVIDRHVPDGPWSPSAPCKARSVRTPVAAACVASCLSFIASGCGGGSSHRPAAATAILAPATVLPVSAECSLPILKDADGNVTPLLCPDGGVNVRAWRVYARGHLSNGPPHWSKVMSLGRGATANQVFDAMCTDQLQVYDAGPITYSAEQLAAAYYGWRFRGNDPATEWGNRPCSG
jgi:hypothetical protein